MMWASATAALWDDYDNDGFMDLLVINYVGNGRNSPLPQQPRRHLHGILTNVMATDTLACGDHRGAVGRL